MELRKLLPLAFGLLLTCCVQESGEIRMDENHGRYLASIEPATKTYLDGVEVKWRENDAISVFESSAGKTVHSRYLLQAGAGTREGAFIHQTAIGETGNSTKTLAYYPFSESNAISAEGAVISHLAATRKITPTKGKACLDEIPMVGEATDKEHIRFFNSCGIVKVRLSGTARIARMTLKGNAGEPLAGNLSVTLEGTTVSVSISGSPSTELTLEMESVQLDENQPTDFFFVIPPTDFTKGLTATVYDDEGGSMDLSVSQRVEVGRNTLQPMSPVKYVPQRQFPGLEAVKDSTIRQYCLNHFDSNQDGKLSYSEASSVTALHLDYLPIETLEGLGVFPNLQTLSCSSEYEFSPQSITYWNDGRIIVNDHTIKSKSLLKSVDITDIPKLRELCLEGNALEEIHLAGADRLQVLNVSYNCLKELDLSGMSSLRELQADMNYLENLDLSSSPLLTELAVVENKLKTLDIKNNPQLLNLKATNNKIVSLDVSQNKMLESLYIESNAIDRLVLPEDSRMKNLFCQYNKITELYVAPAKDLQVLFGGNNLFPFLDLSHNSHLHQIYLYTRPEYDSWGNALENQKLKCLALPKGFQVDGEDVNEGIKLSDGPLFAWENEEGFCSPEGEQVQTLLFNSEALDHISLPEWMTLRLVEGISPLVVTLDVFPNQTGTTREGELVAFSKNGMKTTSRLIQTPVMANDLDWDNVKFHHKSLLMRFTATWCANCPRLAEEMYSAVDSIPNKLVSINMHSVGSDLVYSDASAWETRFGVDGIPYGLLDARRRFTKDTSIVQWVQETEQNYPTSSGISYASLLSGNQLDLDLSVFLKEAGRYRVAAFIVENHIIGHQDGAEEPDTYEHRYVARKAFTPGFGVPFTVEEPRTIRQFHYSITLNPAWNTDEMDIVIYVERTYDDRPVFEFGGPDTYYVDNAVVGKAGGTLPLNTEDATSGGGNEDVKTGGEIILK